MVQKLRRIFRQDHKDTLRHVFGQVSVAHHSQSGRVDEVHVTPDQFRKRCLRPALGIIAQELLIGHPVHSLKSTRIRSKRTVNRYRILARPGKDGPCNNSMFLREYPID